MQVHASKITPAGFSATSTQHHEHCRICAEATGRAADACRDVLSAVRS